MQLSSEERFRDVYKRHADAVTAYVRRRCPADSVDDVVAETFLVCWRKLEHVPDEPLPWLYAVARKTLANQRRASTRHAFTAGGEAADATPQIDGDPVLRRAFALLSEPDREVLRLIAWEHLSLRDTAMTLDCSYVACRVRFHRARRRLAAHLRQLEETATTATPRPHPKGAIR